MIIQNKLNLMKFTNIKLHQAFVYLNSRYNKYIYIKTGDKAGYEMIANPIHPDDKVQHIEYSMNQTIDFLPIKLEFIQISYNDITKNKMTLSEEVISLSGGPVSWQLDSVSEIKPSQFFIEGRNGDELYFKVSNDKVYKILFNKEESIELFDQSKFTRPLRLVDIEKISIKYIMEDEPLEIDKLI